MEERAGCFALFAFLVSHGCCVALLHDSTDVSVVYDCGISLSYSLFLKLYQELPQNNHCQSHCKCSYFRAVLCRDV